MQINDNEFEFLRKLIAVRSVGGSPEPGCPYGKNSRKALDVFLQDAAGKGFRTGVIDDKVGFVEFGNGRKMIGIVCHLDVVPEGSGWDRCRDAGLLRLRQRNGRLLPRQAVLQYAV